MAGRVTATGAGYFYIDDGAACDDGSGMVGVRVLSGSFTVPPIGSRIAVTAISSTYSYGGNLSRALLLPSQENVQILK
ncbi:MAG: hypothetical protein A2Z18_04710 [Armatimonadetes bacterium RBG_16_58_9]|nr:MAG: hypothetical protein A2Z18_04710 [Armatimonadetes bacterium RBG_16_58_9]